MDLDALRAFVAVARAGGFTAAARALRTPQPNLSRRVQQLEREVSAKLVIRAARGVTLTQAGERFLAHADRALRAVEAGVTEISEFAKKPHGAVAIGAISTVTAYVMPDVIAAFHARYPGVLVRMREGLPQELEDLLAAGELDLGVYNLPVRRPEFAARRLWQDDYVLVVPTAHRLSSETRIDLVDVATEPLIVIRGATSTQALMAACEERGVEPTITVETDSVEGVHRMVQRGLGIALLPRLYVMAEVARGVRAVEVSKGNLRRQVAVVHRGEEYLTAAARALRTLLVETRKA